MQQSCSTNGNEANCKFSFLNIRCASMLFDSLGSISCGILKRFFIQFKNFDDMIQNSDTPVLVDFYAVWCGPCVMMSRELVTVGSEMGDKIKIVKIDTDKYPNIASRFQIAALPTCVLFKDGKPIERFEGVMPAEQIKGLISAKL